MKVEDIIQELEQAGVKAAIQDDYHYLTDINSADPLMIRLNNKLLIVDQLNINKISIEGYKHGRRYYEIRVGRYNYSVFIADIRFVTSFKVVG